jgi:(2Fe-2S) ferredoxin
MGHRADKLYQRLEALVDEINGDQYPKPVKLEIANCLDMCGAGPNLMVYPDGVACNGLEEKALEEIVDHYLRE